MAKCLYSEVFTLSYQEGYCWASNAYFQGVFGIGRTQVKQYLGELLALNLLSVELEMDGGRVVKRKLWPLLPGESSAAAEGATPRSESRPTPRSESRPTPGRNPDPPPVGIPTVESYKVSNTRGVSARDARGPLLRSGAKRENAERLSREALVALCFRFASGSADSRRSAPRAVTQAVAEVCGSWSAAGRLPEREWAFLGGRLHDCYIKATKGASYG